MRLWLTFHWVIVTHSVNAALENPTYYFAGRNAVNGARLCKAL
jgi:hypothetical protein